MVLPAKLTGQAEMEELREVIANDEAEKTAFQASKAPLKAKAKKLKAEMDAVRSKVDQLKVRFG